MGLALAGKLPVIPGECEAFLLQGVKNLVFGRGIKPHKVWFGVAAGCRFVIDPSCKTQRIIGFDEAELSGVFRRLVVTVKTFIDVGASDGFYPIIAMRRNPLLATIGCEGQPHFEREARENYKLNFPNGGPVMDWVSKLVGSGQGQVTLDALADGRPGPILVKIDVDGAELDVLSSASKLLSRPDCIALLEVHSPKLESACIELLQKHGFTCRIIKNAWWRCLLPEKRPIGFNRWVLGEKNTD